MDDTPPVGLASQSPPEIIHHSCGILGWNAEPYTCPTDGTPPFQEGYVCGTIGVINKKASPLQLARYCEYQNASAENHLVKMWPHGNDFHCQTNQPHCLPTTYFGMSGNCPLGTRHVKAGSAGACCLSSGNKSACIKNPGEKS